MASVCVNWVSGRAWRATARGMEIIADAGSRSGGQNLGMTPGELLAAALACCTGIDLACYAERHPEVDLAQIRLELTCADPPDTTRRIGQIEMRVSLPDSLSPHHRAILTRIIDNCKIHQTLEHGVEVAVIVEEYCAERS